MYQITFDGWHSAPALGVVSVPRFRIWRDSQPLFVVTIHLDATGTSWKRISTTSQRNSKISRTPRGLNG
jgi:hypothetical protein